MKKYGISLLMIFTLQAEEPLPSSTEPQRTSQTSSKLDKPGRVIVERIEDINTWLQKEPLTDEEAQRIGISINNIIRTVTNNTAWSQKLTEWAQKLNNALTPLLERQNIQKMLATLGYTIETSKDGKIVIKGP